MRYQRNTKGLRERATSCGNAGDCLPRRSVAEDGRSGRLKHRDQKRESKGIRARYLHWPVDWSPTSAKLRSLGDVEEVPLVTRSPDLVTATSLLYRLFAEFPLSRVPKSSRYRRKRPGPKLAAPCFAHPTERQG